jgi:hypothetical protein
VLRIDVRDVRQLQAVILATRQAEPAVNRDIRRYTKEAIVPEFLEALAGHSSTRLEARALVQTARATVSNQNITLSAGKVGKPLSGGLNPKTDLHAVEFGGDRKSLTTYRAHSKKGKSYLVTRHTRAQLRPRKRSGYVFFPTVADIVPRIASLWTQIAVRQFMSRLEGKND